MCPRCTGLLVLEHSAFSWEIPDLRCLNCGYRHYRYVDHGVAFLVPKVRQVHGSCQYCEEPTMGNSDHCRSCRGLLIAEGFRKKRGEG